MDLNNQRRSSNIEDVRGMGGGAGGGGFGGALPFLLLRSFGLRGLVLIGAVLLGINFLAPAPIKNLVFNQLLGGMFGSSMSASAPVQACQGGDPTCDKISAFLGSTEDVWTQIFQSDQLPNYGHTASAYTDPVLVLYSGSVNTGCGGATSDVGPFYCPEDHKLYIDPSFYDVLAQRLNSPGEFAQAYVVAHEIGHHVQSLIGDIDAGPQSDSHNQHSVRIELQADCFAGVWGHNAKQGWHVTDADIAQALNAAHNIGDDALEGQSGQGINPASFTHGTSAQRMRWFKRGFDSGDARQCDTMQGGYDQL